MATKLEIRQCYEEIIDGDDINVNVLIKNVNSK